MAHYSIEISFDEVHSLMCGGLSCLEHSPLDGLSNSFSSTEAATLSSSTTAHETFERRMRDSNAGPIFKPRRGPGRPRKLSIRNNAQHEAPSTTHFPCHPRKACFTNGADLIPVTKPRRGPGRPRKSPAVVEVQTTVASSAPCRGRPRRVSIPSTKATSTTRSGRIVKPTSDAGGR